MTTWLFTYGGIAVLGLLLVLVIRHQEREEERRNHQDRPL
jgi:hypothetical protein